MAMASSQKIRTAWSIKAKDAATVVEGQRWTGKRAQRELDPVHRPRPRAGCVSLQDGAYESIEQLAEANNLHPKVVRQALRLAFLSPDVTSAILEGRQPNGLSLAQIPKLLPLSWAEHRSPARLISQNAGEQSWVIYSQLCSFLTYARVFRSNLVRRS